MKQNTSIAPPEIPSKTLSGNTPSSPLSSTRKTPRSFTTEAERLAYEEGYEQGQCDAGIRKNEIIALIDDDEEVLKMMSLHLEKRGYQTLQASSGEACLQMLQVNRPDIAIIDLGLTDINGEEIFDAIQSDTMMARMGVILISGRVSPEEAVELNRSETCRKQYKRYISKPFNISLLMDKIKELRALQNTDGIVPWAPPLPLEIHFNRIGIQVTRELGKSVLKEQMTLTEKLNEYVQMGFDPESFRPVIVEVLSSAKIRLEVGGRSERLELLNPEFHMVRSQAEELFDRHFPVRASAFSPPSEKTTEITRRKVAHPTVRVKVSSS